MDNDWKPRFNDWTESLAKWPDLVSLRVNAHTAPQAMRSDLVEQILVLICMAVTGNIPVIFNKTTCVFWFRHSIYIYFMSSAVIRNTSLNITHFEIIQWQLIIYPYFISWNWWATHYYILGGIIRRGSHVSRVWWW